MSERSPVASSNWRRTPLFGSDSVQTLPYLLLASMGSYRTADAAGIALLLAVLCLGLTIAADRFGISVLSERQRPAAEIFATKSPQSEKWATVEWSDHLGVPIVEHSLAHIVCGLKEVIPGGDHVIITGDVLEVEARPGEPLVYHGGIFRTLDAQRRGPGDEGPP